MSRGSTVLSRILDLSTSNCLRLCKSGFLDATAASGGYRTLRESYELNPSASSTSRRSVAESTNLYRSSPSVYLRPPPFVRRVGMQLRDDPVVVASPSLIRYEWYSSESGVHFLRAHDDYVVLARYELWILNAR